MSSFLLLYGTGGGQTAKIAERIATTISERGREASAVDVCDRPDSFTLEEYDAVVGSLGATTLLVLLVYMAFTLILLPVAIVGLFAEFLVVLYGQAVFGYLIGRRLPIERDGVATIAGIAAFLLALELFGLVPYLGGIAQLTIAVVGFGAVLNTYFGLQRFEPVTIPGGTYSSVWKSLRRFPVIRTRH